MQSTRLQQSHPSLTTSAAMTSWSDEALVNWISSKKSNQDSAFSILATKYHPWIFRRCLFRLGNHHDAEDATHDIVLRVYANLHQIQEHSKFKAWLNTVINNYCNTFAVHRTRYVNNGFKEQSVGQYDEDNITDPYVTFAEDQMVHHALSSLPENARQVLKLRFFDEYTLKEIAHTQCLTLSAAKARLYRAIELLKNRYKNL